MLAKRTFMTALLIAGATGLIAASPVVDSNNDEIITKAEFDARATMKFDKADANNDGMLNPQERAMLNPRKASKRKMAKRERQRAKMLLEFDTDQNGRLDAREEEVYVASFSNPPKYGMDATEKRKLRNRARIDTNLDGMVSKAEYLVLTDVLFSQTDKNGDGKISRSEGKPLGNWLRSG